MFVTKGTASFDNLSTKAEEGQEHLNRLSKWRKLERGINKIRKAKNWYGKNTETVLFVQATKNEVLRNCKEKLSAVESLSSLSAEMRCGTPVFCAIPREMGGVEKKIVATSLLYVMQRSTKPTRQDSTC